MKSCDEMVNSLLERRERYADEQKRKKKLTIRVVISVFCICFAGIGIWWKGGRLNGTSRVIMNDSVVIDEKEPISSGEMSEKTENAPIHKNEESQMTLPGDNDVYSNGILHDVCQDVFHGDIMGLVVVDGVTYSQFGTDTEGKYTPDIYLGLAGDYEGTYKTYLGDLTAELYTTKEDADVLIVKLGNGGVVTLRRRKELISSYPEACSASYTLPDKGKFGMTTPLREAVNEYGDTVIYRVIVHVFDEEKQIKDKEILMDEANRLFDLGYISVIEEFTDQEEKRTELSIHASSEQILDFSAGADYKYFLLLYDEVW
ncbi:MAG: hypothetical protein E7505_09440 [Ruminococcus sp.]|nr:hypothetical protein [Ruminococcus sp.]